MDFESEARRRKSLKLADWCADLGFKAELVIQFTQAIRDQACDDAGVNRASAKTWELVVGILGAREAIEKMPDRPEPFLRPWTKATG